MAVGAPRPCPQPSRLLAPPCQAAALLRLLARPWTGGWTALRGALLVLPPAWASSAAAAAVVADWRGAVASLGTWPAPAAAGMQDLNTGVNKTRAAQQCQQRAAALVVASPALPLRTCSSSWAARLADAPRGRCLWCTGSFSRGSLPLLPRGGSGTTVLPFHSGLGLPGSCQLVHAVAAPSASSSGSPSGRSWALFRRS